MGLGTQQQTKIPTLRELIFEWGRQVTNKETDCITEWGEGWCMAGLLLLRESLPEEVT